jgi:hypothetical protein
MDMQLQDKLLTYKREMGLLGAGTAASPQALPAEGETAGSRNQNGTGAPIAEVHNQGSKD